MTMQGKGFLFSTASLGILTCAALPAAGASCESLAKFSFPDLTVTLAQSMAPGAFAPPQRGPAPSAAVPVAFCRVTGTLRPTRDSEIKFELWLPATGWTGRYESVGNGGFAGAIRYDSMINPLLGGSAVASTDDGHEASNAFADPSWARGHPEKIVDYAYRAAHVTAKAGKAMTAAFYGNQPHHSYFVGCSKGGGEGMMEAQRYPDDFDGIVVGAKANQFIGLWDQFAWNVHKNLASQASYISPDDLETIGKAVADACDAADGVKDGLIGNPLKCHVNPAAIPLSPEKVKTYLALHDGPKTSAGKQLYPGQAYGAETVGWRNDITGPSWAEAHEKAAMSRLSNGYFANFIYQDPNWDFSKFDVDKDPAASRKQLGAVLDAPDLKFTKFKAHGGKILEFQGWSDAEVTPLGTVDYYRRLGAAQGGAEKTQQFYRLFMEPGMSHCAGGPGPNQFGQRGGNGDAEHDMVVALEQWVEKGIAPARIVATKFVDDDPSKGKAMTRPLCPFPQVAKYKGSGDTNDAANFVCAAD